MYLHISIFYTFFNRVLTGEKTTYFANLLQLHKDVWKNNVDDTTIFNKNIEFQMKKTLHQPHTALFWFDFDVLNNKNFECKVKISKIELF